jgi:hypothetical protein
MRPVTTLLAFAGAVSVLAYEPTLMEAGIAHLRAENAAMRAALRAKGHMPATNGILFPSSRLPSVPRRGVCPEARGSPPEGGGRPGGGG